MSSSSSPKPLISHSCDALNGHVKVPGDKSISHRSLMFGAMATDETIITGLLEGEDVINTATALNQLGAKVYKADNGLWHAYGLGVGALESPTEPIDMGNSGTSTRLLIGLCAGSDVTAFFTGDKSLTKRPMARIMGPLQEMGATFMARNDNLLPLGVKGTNEGLGITYKLPVASAQVKSAIMLAGLTAKGNTTVIEELGTRDHTENLLNHFGANVTTTQDDNGHFAVTVEPFPVLKGCAIHIPADPSSAAFPIVAALIHPGSTLKLPNIGINERRTGLFNTLVEMGANIEFNNKRIEAGEPIADLVVTCTSPLKGIDVPPERNPSMIDEFPILAVAASCAEGTTRMFDLKELRVKESDRLTLMADGLKKCGVNVEVNGDDLIVHGNGKPPKGGAFIECALDHRIAMSFLILGTVSDEPIEIDDGSPIATSFPGFVDIMNDIGCKIRDKEEQENDNQNVTGIALA